MCVFIKAVLLLKLYNNALIFCWLHQTILKTQNLVLFNALTVTLIQFLSYIKHINIESNILYIQFKHLLIFFVIM